MRTVRIYAGEANLAPGTAFKLSEDGFGHLCRVLRFKEGDVFVVFDGKGHEYNAKLLDVKKQALALCGEAICRNNESPLEIELGQVISRGDKMEFTIQKAVELGISKITPLYSSRCGVKLDEKRQERKIQQWQKIANSACEQCYRNVVPTVNQVMDLNAWCESGESASLNLTLDPKAKIKIKDLNIKGKIRLLIGPEGGLSDDEIAKSKEAGFIGVTLGPRILRTETAALAALCVLGAHFGDL